MPNKGQKMSSVRDFTLLVLALAAAEGRTFKSDRGGVSYEIQQVMHKLLEPHSADYRVYVDPNHVTTELRKLEKQDLVNRNHYDSIGEFRRDRTYQASLTPGSENHPEVIRVLKHQEEVIRLVVENHGEPEPPPPPSPQEILAEISRKIEEDARLDAESLDLEVALVEIKTRREALAQEIATLRRAAREGEIGRWLGLGPDLAYYEDEESQTDY